MSGVKDFAITSRYVIGRGALRSIPKLLKDFRCSSVVLFTDEVVYGIVGKELKDYIEDEKVEVGVHFVETSDMREVNRSRSAIRDASNCIVLGVGGGKVIDVAKYSSFLEGVQFISVPTTVSHDGIASPIVALKTKDGKPLSIFTRPPAAVVADLSIIEKAPKRLLRSGFADIIGKITSVRDAYLAIRARGEEISTYSLMLAELSYKIVLRRLDEIASGRVGGIRALIEGALTAGAAMAVEGSSRPCSGSEHLFSHALDYVCPEKGSLHGEQVGVGTIMMAYLHGINWRKIRKALLKVGAPTTCRDLGVPPDCILKALTVAPKLRKRFTILGSEGLTEKAAEKLARTTGVIG